METHIDEDSIHYIIIIIIIINGDGIPDPKRTQVVTENLFQDFPGLFQ
jgi:hypothetical protein